MKKHSIYLLFLFVFLASASFAQNKPKYIFYMIGDGMGLNQVHIAESYAAAIENRNTVFPFTFTQFPFATFATSFSLSHGVTDSAAAGTALSVGKKTKNGVIGMDSSRNETYKSIAYFAKESGMKVGVTTSVSIDHATPAAFYATQPDRGMYYEIGQDLAKSGFDFFAGAGFLSPEKNHKKEDAPSLFPQFEKAGYTLAYGLNDYNTKAKSATKIILMAHKGASNGSLTYAIDRTPEELTLQQITASAIQTLQKDNDNGFFLMVEGGKIDWACHSNDGATAIQETRDFDAAVAEAFHFYKQHPEETLIIVTADHETGGMVLGNGSSTLRLGNIQHQKISQGALSQKISDLRKASPNASWDQVKQVLQENTGLWNEIKPTEHEESDIKEAYQRSFVQHKSETEKSLYAIDDRIAALAVKSVNRASSISWASGNHSAAYIPIYAIGAGANLFSHKMDNVNIPTKIAEAAGWKMSTSKVSVKKK